MPVTARQLETLIRLSTSIAKARFSKSVDRTDAEMVWFFYFFISTLWIIQAYNLLHFACFKEKPKARLDFENATKKVVHDDGEDDEEDEEMETDTPATTQTSTSTRAARGARRFELSFDVSS